MEHKIEMAIMKNSQHQYLQKTTKESKEHIIIRTAHKVF